MMQRDRFYPVAAPGMLRYQFTAMSSSNVGGKA